MQIRPSAVALATALAVGLTALPLAGTAAAHSAPSSCSAQVSPPSKGHGPDAEALCAALAGLPDQDATAALIRVGGKGSWHGVAGVRDIRTGAPALEDARFRAGSVTKVVTASLVLQLAAEGRISLDGTVQHYLPGLLTEDFQPITVRQLLNYTSGLHSGASLGETVEEEYQHRFETLTPQQVVAYS
ncbi:MAG: beta-lactamase family protein, partial [Streptomyces sp.]|nr:beta-lactamase family protein [Streptomyces sp.]